MFIAIVPIIAVVLGILLWALASAPLVKESGKIIFAAGVLVTLLVAAHYTVHVGAGG